MNTKILFVCLDKKHIIHIPRIIKEYQKKFTDFTLYLLCDENFKDIIKTINIEVHNVKVTKLLENISACGFDLYKRSSILDTYLNKINKYYFDLIINLDYEFALSSVIVSYLNAKNIWGPYYDEYGFSCFDNNKYKFLVHSKQDNNLFFYPELINTSLNTSFVFLKNSQFNNLEKFCVVSDNYMTDNITCYKTDKINKSDYLNAAKEFDFTITDDEIIANFNNLNNINTIFVSNDYKNFYNVYPYNNCIKYLLNKNIYSAIESLKSKTSIFFKAIQDKYAFVYIVPETPISLSEEIFNFFILKAVWKSMVVKETLVGDSNKFVSLGEKYIDRIMDINVEIDFLNECIFSHFNKESVVKTINDSESILEEISKFKKLTFEGTNISKSYLHVVSSADYNFENIKIKNKELIEHDKKINDFTFTNTVTKNFICYFKNERNNYHLKNLFPMVKEIILTYETLYSKICFYEELLKGLIRGVKNV